MQSFWESAFELKKADVLIVGAGIVGLSTAYHLKKSNPKLQVAVLERHLLPNGASTKNAGFACFGSITELLSDIKQSGLDPSLKLVEERVKGLALLRKIHGDKALDYRPVGGYEIFKDTSAFLAFADEIQALNQHLAPIVGADCFSRSDESLAQNFGMKGITGLIFNQYEGSINPMLMMQSWMRKCKDLDVKLYMGGEVESYQKTNLGYQVNLSSKHQLHTSTLAFCTNGFTPKFFPDLDIKPARAQVLVTEEIPGLKLQGCFHLDEGYYYFRNIGNRILLGGGRNEDFEAETSSEQELNPKIQSSLDHILTNIIAPHQELKVAQRWTGIMAVGKDKSPIVKEYSDGVFIAARLGGMGVALGSQVGKNLAELISP